MSNKLVSMISLLLLLLLAACAIFKPDAELPNRHPEELGRGNPDCLECHDPGPGRIDYNAFVHSLSWGREHRQAAYQNASVCTMCHQTSYCNDCHAAKVELKPSLKNQDETYRNMPHRGDYLTRHRIDGRINPTSCYRCHGNPKASRTCLPCHG